MATFDVLVPSRPRMAVVAHIPHASTVIPDPVRAEILLDDASLAAELIRLTDWHTDRLFSWLLDHGATMFVNRLSRLVFDPERFVGDTIEPTEAVGQGVVYTRTTAGVPFGFCRQRTDRGASGRCTSPTIRPPGIGRPDARRRAPAHPRPADPLPTPPDRPPRPARASSAATSSSGRPRARVGLTAATAPG